MRLHEYILMLSFIIIIILIILLITQKRRISKRVIDENAMLMKRHYDEVRNTYKQMRGWRHDFHNHIQTLRASLAMSQYDKADDYLESLDVDLTRVDNLIKSGNIMLDAILNSKITLAISNDINVKYKVALSEDLSVSDIDLCIIIGNLLDNAIDACNNIQKSDDRFIRIYISKIKEQLYISVSNSTAYAIRNDKNIFHTTKNKITHGNGLRRIDQVVDKYLGHVNRQNEPYVFATEVNIPL